VLIHDRLGFIVVVIAAAGALFALATLLRPSLLPTLRVFLTLEVATVGVQVVVGLVLFATGQRPQQVLHLFYGAATLLALPLALFLGRSRPPRDEHVWIIGGAVLTLLFAFRAVTTA